VGTNQCWSTGGASVTSVGFQGVGSYGFTIYSDPDCEIELSAAEVANSCYNNYCCYNVQGADVGSFIVTGS